MLNLSNDIYATYSEKRDYLRMQVALDVEFTLAKNQRSGRGTTLNLSSQGILFTTDHAMTPGESATVRVLPVTESTNPLQATAEVLRVELLDDGKFLIACTLQNVH